VVLVEAFSRARVLPAITALTVINTTGTAATAANANSSLHLIELNIAPPHIVSGAVSPMADVLSCNYKTKRNNYLIKILKKY
jgi:hypothetical protein